jgi:hypothetical protein
MDVALMNLNRNMYAKQSCVRVVDMFRRVRKGRVGCRLLDEFRKGLWIAACLVITYGTVLGGSDHIKEDKAYDLVMQTVSNHWFSGEVGASRLHVARLLKNRPLSLFNISSNTLFAASTTGCVLFAVDVISPKLNNQLYESSSVIWNGYNCTIIKTDNDAIRFINSMTINRDNLLDATSKTVIFGELRRYQLATRDTFRAITSGLSTTMLQDNEKYIQRFKPNTNTIALPDCASSAISNRFDRCTLAVETDEDGFVVYVVFTTLKHIIVEKWARYKFHYDNFRMLQIIKIDDLGMAGGFL